ncbi:zinc-ribbon domain-containing protein [Leucobacter sp. HY1910]
MAGINDLATTHPALAAQWHPELNQELTPDQVSHGSKTPVWWQCTEGHAWLTPVWGRKNGLEACPECWSLSTTSPFEAKVADFIASLNTVSKVHRNRRGLLSETSQELDIYLPEHHVAVECNGVYWHSEPAGKDKHYHRQKLLAARAAGIRLVQVWEDDWRDRQPIVERLLASILSADQGRRVGARTTAVEELTLAEARDFCDAHHLQGYAHAGVRLGLRTRDGELVAVMLVRRRGLGQIELVRFVTSVRVPGGFTKLWKAVDQLGDWTEAITFSDESWASGDLYAQHGWTRDGDVAPDYAYLAGASRAHKFGYRLKRFRSDPALTYQEGWTEAEAAAANNLHRIWDSGKVRWRIGRSPAPAQH